MTESQVRAKLGRPNRKSGSGRSVFRTLYYARREMLVYLARGKVDAVATTSRRQRTRAGVGVGSTESRLRRTQRNLRCGRVGRRRECQLGRPGRARVITTFTIRRGRVSQVAIAVSV